MTIAENMQTECLTIVGAHSCPKCGKPVTIASPRWLHIQRDFPSKVADFQIDVNELDLCLDCIADSITSDDLKLSWTATANTLRNVRNRLDLPANVLVYHQRGSLVPSRGPSRNPIQLDEFFLVLNGHPPANWNYPMETITRADGRQLRRLFVAQSLSPENIDATIRVVWSGGRSDGTEAFSTLEIDRWDQITLNERNELVRLARTASDRLVRTDHTQEDVERQLAEYLRRMKSLRYSRPSRNDFIRTIRPSMSIGTWNNNMKRWGTNWKTMRGNVQRNLD